VDIKKEKKVNGADKGKAKWRGGGEYVLSQKREVVSGGRERKKSNQESKAYLRVVD